MQGTAGTAVQAWIARLPKLTHAPLTPDGTIGRQSLQYEQEDLGDTTAGTQPAPGIAVTRCTPCVSPGHRNNGWSGATAGSQTQKHNPWQAGHTHTHKSTVTSTRTTAECQQSLQSDNRVCSRTSNCLCSGVVKSGSCHQTGPD
jgi:hypothetical protein